MNRLHKTVSRIGALAAMAAALLALTGAAQANDVLNGTYTFTSTDGDQSADGSTVTFDNNCLVSWDLNAIIVVNPYVDPETTFDLNFTTANSHVTGPYNYVTGTDGWAFDFVADVVDPLGDPTFEASNDAVYYQPSYYQLYGIPYGPGIDPVGYWTADVAPVPDAMGTMQLLLGALTALGFGQRFVRAKRK